MKVETYITTLPLRGGAEWIRCHEGGFGCGEELNLPASLVHAISGEHPPENHDSILDGKWQAVVRVEAGVVTDVYVGHDFCGKIVYTKKGES